MEILEAYDLTGSYRSAAELAGCDHHTVARYVKMRAAGQHSDARRHRDRAIDAFLPKIEELVVRSNGRIRADVRPRLGRRPAAGRPPPPRPSCPSDNAAGGPRCPRRFRTGEPDSHTQEWPNWTARASTRNTAAPGPPVVAR
jgi:hypothetical protein